MGKESLYWTMQMRMKKKKLIKRIKLTFMNNNSSSSINFAIAFFTCGFASFNYALHSDDSAMRIVYFVIGGFFWLASSFCLGVHFARK